VSQICLGTMMFGGPTEEAEARRIMDHALESGVNFIDTADVYAQGRSEAIIGPAIKAKRDRWVLATKLAQSTGPAVTDSGLSRRYMMKAVEASLKRLQTDHIDLYYIHRVDPNTPWESTIATFGDLIRQGKVREWALSNVRAWHIPHVVHLCRQLGVPPPVALQPYYNLMNRQPEVSCCRRPRPSVSASCPTAPSRAACSPASTRSTRRPIPAAAPAARTSACWNRSGGPRAC
jgi:aryl-alcohol dehydrogenase-like predicted oxidoreductase